MTVINVCISCDENYAKYASVVIASILSNACDDDVLHISTFLTAISLMRADQKF